MYEAFFGLTCEPFSVAADPRFIYLSPKHRQARAHLRHGLRRGAGFILLTGEIGAGKTTVCRLFLREMSATVDVAYVVNPRLDARALLTRICEDLRVDAPPGTADLIDAIHGHLLLAHSQGRRTLIVVDEAQALSIDVLEQLRLLTNLDSTGGKLQVFLIGQPELRTMLQLPVLEPVAQRMVARFHLPALQESETARYIARRLDVAGLVGPVPFDEEALGAIHRRCGGIPRRINVLCDQAMLAAEAAGTRRINKEMIESVAADVFDDPPVIAQPQDSAVEVASDPIALLKARPHWAALAAVAVGALIVGALLGQGHLTGVSPAAQVASNPAPAPAIQAPAIQAPAIQAPVSQAPAIRAPVTLAPATQAPATQTPPAAAPGPSLADDPVLAKRAGAASPVGSAATAAAAPQYTGMQSVLNISTSDEWSAWRALARVWGVNPAPGQPCVMVMRLDLRCYRNNGGLEDIRQLGRPSILTLVGNDQRVAYALLVGLTADSATFSGDGPDATVRLAELAGRWHGEFATLWRPPPGYRVGESMSAGNPVTSWMDQRLALVDAVPPANGALRANAASAPSGDAALLTARVSAFQLSHGLQPDGLAGPMTLMQLNRASGISEPRLRTEP